MKELTVKFTVEELQTILQALGNLPYVQVHELIANIQFQATPQLQGMNGTPETEHAPQAKKEAKKAEKTT